MRYAVNVPNFEDYSDVRTVAALAADAEAAGWDGFFVWDHLTFVKAWRLRIADPWLLLAGVAVGAFAGHEDAVRRCVRVTGETLPDPEGVAFYNRQFQFYRRIQAALAPIYHEL